MGFMDFFKPQWKHSDPSVRAAAIRGMDDDHQDALLAMALEDEDPANRAADARRVKDTAMLRRLKDRSNEKLVKDLAAKQLLENLAAAAKSGSEDPESLAAAKAALAEIGDEQRTLEDVACNAASRAVREAAFLRLTHAGAIHSVALGEADEGLALKAFAKVAKDSHFESLSRNAKSKAVRAAAKERLKSAAAAKGPDAGAVNRAKLSLVLSVAEKAAAAASDPPRGYAWEAVKEQVDEADRSLRELIQAGTLPDPARLARFREELDTFRAGYARHVEELAAREERDRREAEAKARKESLIALLEAADGADKDALDIRDLREQFVAAGKAGAAEDDLQRRFRTAADKVERDRERRAREKELAERRAADEREHGGTLKALVEEAEALAPKAEEKPALVGERYREIRREWTKAFNASGPFDGKDDLKARLDAAFASAGASLEQARARNLARMQVLLPELEHLLEDPDMQAAEKRFKELHSEWKTLLPVPHGPEAEEVLGRHQAFLDRFREAQDWLRWSNLRTKQLICDRLEALEKEEDRKAVFARLKELQAEWKSVGPVPWDSSEALWDRYHGVSDRLYEKCREYFAELEVERESNLKAKEEWCARVEAIVSQEDIDWREAMEVVKEAQGAWKTIGAVPKAQSEALWARFRAACNAFYERKEANQKGNLEKKLELVALAESLQDSTEWKAAGQKIKEAQEKWKSIGPVPKDQSEAVWARFHGACEKFFQARKAHLDQLDAERPQNQARKEELCAAVESLDALATDQERFDRIKEAQAAWKEIGPVPREVEDALWERFRKPIDAYFEGRKGRLDEERKSREGNAQAKEDICIEAESLKDSTEWKATIEKIKALQERWKATGPAPREVDQALWRRFRAACDVFFERLKENAGKRDSERMGNLRKKTDLCFLAEMLSTRALTPEEDAALKHWQSDKHPQEFVRFLADEGPVDYKERTEKIKALQREWKAIGPVPRDVSDSIWERFHAACDAFFEERRSALGLPAEDPQANLERKLDLIAEAESLAQNPGGDAANRARALQRDWRRIGPVPRAQSDYIWRRFTAALETVLGEGGAAGGNESEAEAETPA